MSKEAIFFPDFPAPDEGNGFAVRPDTENRVPTFPSYCLTATSFRGIFAGAEGIIDTLSTDETIPVGFGTIQVVPVWRFLLEMEP